MRHTALCALLALASCSGSTPVITQQQIVAACMVDGALHPIVNSVASLAPAGAVADDVAYAAIQAYCQSLGGYPTVTTAQQIATAVQDTQQAVAAATAAAQAAQAAAQAAKAAASAPATPTKS